MLFVGIINRIILIRQGLSRDLSVKFFPVGIYYIIMELEEINLDDRAVSILRVVRDLDGECTTRDVRDALDLSRGIVNYRIDEYLEPHDLLIGRNQKVEPGEMRPKELEITKRGLEYLETATESEDGDSIPGRIQKLENEVEELRNENKKLKRKISPLHDNIGTINWTYIRVRAICEMLKIDNDEMTESHQYMEDIMQDEGSLISKYED